MSRPTRTRPPIWPQRARCRRRGAAPARRVGRRADVSRRSAAIPSGASSPRAGRCTPRPAARVGMPTSPACAPAGGRTMPRRSIRTAVDPFAAAWSLEPPTGRYLASRLPYEMRLAPNAPLPRKAHLRACELCDIYLSIFCASMHKDCRVPLPSNSANEEHRPGLPG